MNIFDLVILLLCGFAALRGWRLGLLGQVFELGGGFVGLLLGLAIGPRLASSFTDQAGVEGLLISLLTVFVLLSLGQALGYMFGHRFRLLAGRAQLGEVDTVLGAGFGIVVTLLSVWLVGSMLVKVPSRPVARAVRNSAVMTALDTTLPRPPNVLGYLRHYLDTSGFPEVFAGLPPPIGEPVKLPSGGDYRQALNAARGSTVRVVVPACGGTQLGSGWIAGPDVVVTNAHVVAGGGNVTVQELDGSEHSATVVVFDPDTDVAVMRASGLSASPLPLNTETLTRGTGGATIGFPGSAGGDQVAHKAAVRDRYDATGLDIYGRSEAEREVYELRSPVRKGDSGGPFVLPSGEVAGVVFAASTTSGNTGYALTAAEVADEVNAGRRRTQATSTGGCAY